MRDRCTLIWLSNSAETIVFLSIQLCQMFLLFCGLKQIESFWNERTQRLDRHLHWHNYPSNVLSIMTHKTWKWVYFDPILGRNFHLFCDHANKMNILNLFITSPHTTLFCFFSSQSNSVHMTLDSSDITFKVSAWACFATFFAKELYPYLPNKRNKKVFPFQTISSLLLTSFSKVERERERDDTFCQIFFLVLSFSFKRFFLSQTP